MKLAQTLAGSWVITVENPEEPGWETELACFDTSATAPGSTAEAMVERAAAAAFRVMAGDAAQRCIQSHDPAALQRMQALCAAAGLDLGRVRFAA